MLIIKNAQIFSMQSGVAPFVGYMKVSGETISDIGLMGDYDADNEKADDDVIDAQNAVVTPGFIDAHSHLGLFNDSLDVEGSDGNEMTDPITPHLRAIDGVHNADICFKEAYEGGVSIVMTGPGSGNVLGGQFAILKTYEKTVEEALVKTPAAQKAAFGENPKRVYGKDNKSPQTRMATAGLLRETLIKALDYKEKQDEYFSKLEEYNDAIREQVDEQPDKPDKPDTELILESLIPVLECKIPIKIHAHRQDDILTAIRICNEFGLVYTLEHCTEGHLIKTYLSEEYQKGQKAGRGEGRRNGAGGKLLGVIIGPMIGDRSKPELSHLSLKTASELQSLGLPVALMTDHPCVPQQYLSLSAAMAVRGGMLEEDALAAITRVPAEILGISDQYGSLEKGKVADFSIFSHHPLEYKSRLWLFVGGGKIHYRSGPFMSDDRREKV